MGARCFPMRSLALKCLSQGANTSLLAFVLAFGIALTFNTYLSPTPIATLYTAMMSSTSLSLTSLASLMFPNIVQPLLYVFYALLSLSNLHSPVEKGFQWVHHRIMEKLHIVLTRMQLWNMRSRTKFKVLVESYLPRTFFLPSSIPDTILIPNSVNNRSNSVDSIEIPS
ncbi:hypothetical protein AAG906_003195 [Vitis piasezkii]